ncbi:MAG: HAMP domain-containing protein, partial [Thermocrinis sp.]|nr:HAMP domain-containing protein [Thermocrinis sp.]
MERAKLFFLFFLFFIFFVGINILFLDNLRKIWTVGFPLILLVINLDLLILVVVFSIFFRKFIKTYLQAQRGNLRRRLSNLLFLYMFLPILFLNLASSIVLLQSTKTFVSSQLKEVAQKTEELLQMANAYERDKLEEYRSFFYTIISKGEDPREFASALKGVKSVEKAPCVEEERENAFILCVGDYRVEILKDQKLKNGINALYEVSTSLRNLVKSRDIIGGIYIYFLVLISLVALLASLWFGNLVARHISVPLEELSSKAREIAKGNFDVFVGVPNTEDEVSQLARSFSTMKEELRELYSRLEKEKETLRSLIESLPIGIRFVGKGGEVIENQAYREMSKEDPQVRKTEVQLPLGLLEIYEDLRPIITAERFRTWQDAVKRLAHEIKNPLTPISLHLERLQLLAQRDKLSKEEVINVCGLLLKEINRIKSAVNYFRDLSYQREIKVGGFELGDLIRELARLYPNLEVEVIGSSFVKADRSMIKECFFNLFNNSVEWGAKKVKVSLTEEGFIYEDDGKGIQEGEEELIFMPYKSSNPEGMGLGLAMVKHIFELHGWSIKVFPK